VYSGSYHPDYEAIEQRGSAFSEYLQLRDEVEERSPLGSLELGVDPLKKWRHRSSAVAGLSGLALERLPEMFEIIRRDLTTDLPPWRISPIVSAWL
jgi:hypothetical protein